MKAKLKEMIIAQGGDGRVCDDTGLLPAAPVIRKVSAPCDGYLEKVDGVALGLAAQQMGAGRIRKGDAIDPAVGFVMEHENMSYTEALKYLARKYHIEVVEKEETAEEIAQRQRNESLLLVSEFAGKFFQESLQTPEGQAIGYQYFKSRGLEDETIRKYGLGWAPVSRKALSDAARAAGYKEEFLVETGLSIKYDDGRLVDRFFDRVMFPIHSASGRVIWIRNHSISCKFNLFLCERSKKWHFICKK